MNFTPFVDSIIVSYHFFQPCYLEFNTIFLIRSVTPLLSLFLLCIIINKYKKNLRIFVNVI